MSPIYLFGSLKVENLPLLCSEGDVTVQERVERCSIARLEAGEREPRDSTVSIGAL